MSGPSEDAIRLAKVGGQMADLIETAILREARLYEIDPTRVEGLDCEKALAYRELWHAECRAVGINPRTRRPRGKKRVGYDAE